MSATNDFLDGAAQTIVSAGIATLTPSVSDTGLYFSLMPAGSTATPPGPDRCVVLTAYTVGDDAANPWSKFRLQIRTRGTEDPRDVDALTDQLYDLFQSLRAVTFGSVTAAQFLRVSNLPMGQDSNRRWERSQNFDADCSLLPTVNRPA